MALLPPAPLDHPEWKAFIDAAREIENELRLAQARCRQLEEEVAEVRATSEALKEEVRQAHEEYDRLYRKSSQRDSMPPREDAKARAERERERNRFREIVGLMHREVEYLKKVYPLFDLLEAKEAEIRHYRSLLERVPPQHPDRPAMEAAVQAHLAERNEIRMIAEEGRKRLDGELADMQALLDVTDPDETSSAHPEVRSAPPKRRAKRSASLG